LIRKQLEAAGTEPPTIGVRWRRRLGLFTKRVEETQKELQEIYALRETQRLAF
jgi:hypothetical protein